MAISLPSPDPQPREDPQPATVERFELETCAIQRWRGYVCSSFVALTADGTPIAESSEFRWRRATEPPNEGAPREAYVALVAALERLGWERCDSEDVQWFATSFSRLIAVADVPRPSQVPPPPLPAPAAPRAVAPVEQVLPAPASPRAVAPVEQMPPAPASPRAVAPVEQMPHAAPPAPATAAGPATPPRRGRLIAAVTVAGAVAALGVGVTVVTHGGGSAHHAVIVEPGSKTASASPVQASPAVAPLVRLQIVAKNRASWLELRRGSRTGRVLYTGKLAVGDRLHFVAARIWAQFGAAGNLTITSNGQPVVLIGTFEHVFTAKR